MKKITVILLIITIVVFVGSLLLPKRSVAKTDTEQNKVYLNIIVSNKAEYEIVKKIVMDKHNVQYLFSNQNDLKSFNPNDKKVLDYSDVDLFFYVGKNYEPWLNQVLENIDKRKTGVVDVSRGIRNFNLKLSDKGVNPYYWTGLQEYFVQLFNIKSTIEEKDPKNKDYYEKKYHQAIKEIQSKVDSIENHKIDKRYTFIAVDDKLDYFYDDLSIDVVKCDSNDLDDYINKKHLDISKVIILKDIDTAFTKGGFKVVNLQTNNYAIPTEQMILNNYKAIYSLDK